MDKIAATRQLIQLALDEDIGNGDLTALAVPPDARASAKVVAKEDCVLSGLELASLVLEVFGADAQVAPAPGCKDGQDVKNGQTILEFSGRARDLLTTERTILNLLQRTCGVATQARRFHDALGGQKLTILDTRKTIPGLRHWDKKAVKDGGLENHRSRLDEAVLLKENHIRASGSIRLALANLQGKVPASTPIEVEVTNWEEIDEALGCGVTRLLLDNFLPGQLAELVKKIRAIQPRVHLEASGGITLENIKSYAGLGLDCVSVGALTHSVRAADLSYLFEVQ
jgi:nicotinate-nucleotide pyrophosphorylase (carboxylating)